MLILDYLRDRFRLVSPFFCVLLVVEPCHPGQAGVLDGSATIRWGEIA